MFRFLFPLALFLSAVLLFSIQPMAARALLPVYGGTPAVWTVCMLFFQGVLLVAYGYVALLVFCKKPRTWRLIHSVLLGLSFCAIPLLFRPLVMNGAPEWSILFNLLTQIGLPLLIIGASAPLLQFAYSQTKEKGASDPYFLYIASNCGSLCALLFYPVVIERFIGLKNQFYLWSMGYVIYVCLLFFLLFAIRYQPIKQAEQERASFSFLEMSYWVFLSFVPCSLLLGVTLYITTDVAATPLFWVVPLALYLVTFILAFMDRPIISFTWLSNNALFFLIFTILGFILNVSQIKAWQSILFNLLSFFVLALLCHRRLFLKRPKPQLLTLYYFCLALGGVLAGIFNGILAPHWFNQVYEYPLAILLSFFAIYQVEKSSSNILYHLIIPIMVLFLLIMRYFIPTMSWPGGFSSYQVSSILALLVIAFWQRSISSLFLSMLFLFAFIFSPTLQEDIILVQERNFYGIKKVIRNGDTHALISQSTIHGLQWMTEKNLNGFSSYYGAIQPVIELLHQKGSPISATIIGLGIGTMVCQFNKADQVKVIEIDPQVIKLATNTHLFTYMKNCPPSVEIIKNDGRLAIEQLDDKSQTIVIVDAFNSDAIPVHLMTYEAFALYRQKISKEGLILVNLSNRHLELLPVLTAIGRSLNVMVFQIHHKGNPSFGQFDSEWALMTTNQDLALKLMRKGQWRFVASDKEFLWTDDYSNLIPLLKW